MLDLTINATAIARRLEAVNERIVRACQRTGRKPEEVTLVAVTKTFPIEAIDAAREAGLRHFGENRVQELVEKARQRPGHYDGGEVWWHMIGHLQRNKAKEVVACADLFHGLDSRRLAKAVNERAGQAGRVLPCLIQVNVSGEESKFGVTPAALPALLDVVAACRHLRLRGLMTLAAPAINPEEVRPQFRLLRTLLETCTAYGEASDPLDVLSMGMSGDFEVAIEEGATHVRIGTALFGQRT